MLDTDGFYNKLRKVNISKAYGCDGITPKEMEIVAKEICCSIAHKGKMSYSEGNIQLNGKLVNSNSYTREVIVGSVVTTDP